ncbi:hypothetical protein [Prosthecobacter dejongeii]|uniref:Chaperonin cofactor prefoldin n=1 Tax=Prosthecobacter dejongeii TaxID=48465 RepID=A0A7W8DRN9_9BACT|nr:hypothetical protein [Prosthecobacter dejongeii]MBB5039647.1 chaperonin cofactor prefoldin [Prosthecobacter dejongeii]
MQAQPQDIQQQIEQLQERLDSLQETLNANAPSDLARDHWGDVEINSILFKDPAPPGYLDSDIYKLAAEIDSIDRDVGRLKNDLDRQLLAQQARQPQPHLQAQASAVPVNPPAASVNANVATSFYADPAKQQAKAALDPQPGSLTAAQAASYYADPVKQQAKATLDPQPGSLTAAQAASYYADPVKQQAKAALDPQPGSLTAAQAASYYADPAKQQAKAALDPQTGGGATAPSVRDILRGAAKGMSQAANSVKETIQAKLGLLSHEEKVSRVEKQIEKRNDHGNDLRAKREELFNGRPPVPNNRADRDQLIQTLQASLDNPQMTDPSQRKDLADKLDKCKQANKLDERIGKNESKIEGLTQKKEDLQAKLKTGASLPANANNQGVTTAIKVR